MPPAAKTDYYEVLGVPHNSSEQEIKSAYRKLAMRYHPDRNPGDKAAEERFKEAAEAYSVLGDPEKRRRYDTYGHAGVSSTFNGGFDPTIFADFGDILGDFFGFGDLFGRRRSGPRRGADLRYNLDLTFKEAAFGLETSIQIPRSESCGDCRGSGSAAGTQPAPCPTCRGAGQTTFQQGFFSVARTCNRCQGSGRVVTHPCKTCDGKGLLTVERKLQVQIPAGVDSGNQLRLAGEGEAGLVGGPPGDLYVFIRVQEHPFFTREGSDLFCEIPISFTQAALGGAIEVPALDQAQPANKLDLPEGTQTGSVFKLRGQGVARLGAKSRGDLHVAVRVLTPTKLSHEQRRLLEQLGQELPKQTATQRPRGNAPDKSFKDRLKDILS